jgi:hypothetical protein
MLYLSRRLAVAPESAHMESFPSQLPCATKPVARSPFSIQVISNALKRRWVYEPSACRAILQQQRSSNLT